MSSLTVTDINTIMALIDGSEFDSLKLQMGDLTLELNCGAAGPIAPVSVEAATPAAKPVGLPAEGRGNAVPAPLLGTFYHAPKPGAAPFVKVGDTVSPDTVIGVIEVMKLMNSVTAGVAGKVTEVCAPNGSLVEHGQALIRIESA